MSAAKQHLAELHALQQQQLQAASIARPQIINHLSKPLVMAQSVPQQLQQQPVPQVQPQPLPFSSPNQNKTPKPAVAAAIHPQKQPVQAPISVPVPVANNKPNVTPSLVNNNNSSLFVSKPQPTIVAQEKTPQRPVVAEVPIVKQQQQPIVIAQQVKPPSVPQIIPPQQHQHSQQQQSNISPRTASALPQQRQEIKGLYAERVKEAEMMQTVLLQLCYMNAMAQRTFDSQQQKAMVSTCVAYILTRF